jgi:hypothetical protein
MRCPALSKEQLRAWLGPESLPKLRTRDCDLRPAIPTRGIWSDYRVRFRGVTANEVDGSGQKQRGLDYVRRAAIAMYRPPKNKSACATVEAVASAIHNNNISPHIRRGPCLPSASASQHVMERAGIHL